MCRAALQSPRKSIIFEPYPSIVDPLNPKTLAFSPKVSPRLISSTAQAPQDLLFFTLKCWCCVTGTELREAAKDSSQHPVNQNHGTGIFLYYLFTDKWLFWQPESRSNCSGWLKMTLFFSWNIQGPPSEIKKQMDKRDPLAHPLLMWWVALPGLQNCVHPPLFLKLKLCVCNRILSSNKSHIVKLSQNQVLLNQALLAQKSHIKYY